jgi:hypothetical protein
MLRLPLEEGEGLLRVTVPALVPFYRLSYSKYLVSLLLSAYLVLRHLALPLLASQGIKLDFCGHLSTVSGQCMDSNLENCSEGMDQSQPCAGITIDRISADP